MSNINLEQRRISVSELPSDIPDFSSSFEPKDSLIKKWIMNWILSAISKKQIKENDILPSKSEISEHLGVSIGTVQNAIRYVEDEGFLKSKQRLGTMISNTTNPITKSTSRRDKTILAVKKYIIQKDLKLNKHIPSTRKMSEYLGISQNTVRLAYEFLCREGIIESRQIRGNESNWILIKYPELSIEKMKQADSLETETLVNKITEDLKHLLSNNFNIGEKIPSHEQLAKQLNVSVKTIHDCIQKLSNLGILISRRGRYGTILAQNPLSTSIEMLQENDIFMSAEDAAFYSYQKIESKISDLIRNNYKAGDKLPSMKELSLQFDVSTNTIRKALNSLSEQGYITFGRGRYGGTFIVDLPEKEEVEAYQWLSINPEFM